MKKIIQSLNRFWFSEAPPERLGVIRILIGLYALYYIGTRFDMLMEMAVLSPSLFDPVGAAWFLDSPLSVLVVKTIVIATLALNVLFILGWKFRYTGPLFSVLLLFVFCYRNSWSMVYHSHNVLVFHILILGFTASADSVSLDALKRSRIVTGLLSRAERAKPRVIAPSWRYGWPVMLMCAVTVIAYFLAGYAKVESELGWGWMGGEILRSQIAVDGLRKEVLESGAPGLVYFLYNEVYIFTLLGVTAFVLELGAPLALANRRIGKIWAVTTFMMHWGIFFIMGIKFRYQMSGILFAPFFDMEKVLTWFRPKKAVEAEETAQGEKPVVFFDGVCNFCNNTVKFILEEDKDKVFNFAPLKSDTAKEMLDERNLDELGLSSIVLIERDGVYTKSTAALMIAQRLPGYWPLLYAFIVVPVPIRDFLYDRFAENRYRLFGRDESCFVPTEEIKGRFLD